MRNQDAVEAIENIKKIPSEMRREFEYRVEYSPQSLPDDSEIVKFKFKALAYTNATVASTLLGMILLPVYGFHYLDAVTEAPFEKIRKALYAHSNKPK